MERWQSTLRRKIRMAGVGLHGGRIVTMEIAPAPANMGIVFERTDLPASRPIPATAANVVSSELCTTIGNGSAKVSTIEHLMAAFVGLGIDNAFVRLDAAEVPIMDGSSAPFVDRILGAGIAKLETARRLYVVKDAFEIRDGDRVMRVEPDDRLRFACRIDFARSAAIGEQTIDFTFSTPAFLKLSEARTFCHVDDVNAMRRAGLALGGSLDNAVVVNDTGVINADGLRSDDEFVRHKLLDCIGDLGLLGAPLVGKITLDKAGHGVHVRFVQELLRRKAELLSVVEVGGFREKRPAMSDDVASIVAAAAVSG